MFIKQYRLPVNRKLHNARTQSTSVFFMKYTPNTLNYNRYGFVVSKKIDKRAVIRNQIKRCFRAQIEHMHKGLVQGNDYLFILYKEAKDKRANDFYELLIDTFGRKGLLL